MNDKTKIFDENAECIIDIWKSRFEVLDNTKKTKYGFGILLNYDNQEPTPLRQFAKGADQFMMALEKVKGLKKLPAAITLIEYTDNKPGSTEVTKQEIELGEQSNKKPSTPKKKKGLEGLTAELEEKITKNLQDRFEREQLQKELQAAKLTISELEAEIKENEKELEKYYKEEDRKERMKLIGGTTGDFITGLVNSLPGAKPWLESKGLGVIVNMTNPDAADDGPQGLNPNGPSKVQGMDKREFMKGITEWFASLHPMQYNKVVALFMKLGDDMRISDETLDKALAAIGIENWQEYMAKEKENATKNSNQNPTA